MYIIYNVYILTNKICDSLMGYRCWMCQSYHRRHTVRITENTLGLDETTPPGPNVSQFI